MQAPVKRRFLQRKTEVAGINDQWQIDLIDIKKYKGANSHFKYLLTCIDVFSKYAWVVPIKRKEAIETKNAFEKIFIDGIPNYIYSDKGREFMGACNKYFKEKGIVHLETNSLNKASVVERFNRTLKERIWRFLSKNLNSNAKRFIHILPDLVTSYNSTYHEAVGTSPDKVNKQNEEQIRQRLYGQNINLMELESIKDPSVISENTISLAFKIGDYVWKVDDNESKTEKTRYDRGHVEKFSRDLFIVREIIPTKPPVYVLYDVKNDSVLQRKYYKEELQKALGINKDTYHLIRKVKDRYLVQKVNSNDRIESWVDKELLIRHNVPHSEK